MDSKEFCKLIKQAKKKSHITSSDIASALNKTTWAIYDVLAPKYDFTMQRYIPILEICNHCIKLSKDEIYIIADSNEKITKWINYETDNLKISIRQFAREMEVDASTILNILKGGSVRISLFLKFADYFGYTVTIDEISND